MKNTEKNSLPLLTLVDTVAMPTMFTQLSISKTSSKNAINALDNLDDNKHIIIVTQRDRSVENPNKLEDFYNIGVYARIIQSVKLEDDTIKIVIEGSHRVFIHSVEEETSNKLSFLKCKYNIIYNDNFVITNVIKTKMKKLKNLFFDFLNINNNINSELLHVINNNNDYNHIINLISVHLVLDVSIKQEILEIVNLENRIELLINIINNQIMSLKTNSTINNKVKEKIAKTQRSYFLNEKIKVIQDELKDLGSANKEISSLGSKIKKLKLNKEAKEKITYEIDKMESLNPMSAEFSLTKTYIDYFTSLPWGKLSSSNIDIDKSSKFLNKEHYGIEEVKDRILEYLSVLKRSKNPKGPILCFVGPPGVGKTSLVKSIAESIGRKYYKISLGGVTDESEIRGHRKTYVGAMPGRIINAFKVTGTDNPIILLDELDKVNPNKGDPNSALLEVLDSQQNKNFRDNYLECGYDISKAIYIATANSLNIPHMLLDRMEIIRLSGYTEKEKLKIATKFLLPKVIVDNQLKPNEIEITEDAILDLIRYYTKESGVRNIEKSLAKIARKVLRKILFDKKDKSYIVTSKDLEKYLGVKKYNYKDLNKANHIGATTGLAYTNHGGDLLTIEALQVPGKGNLKGTGKLGDVMKESSQAAYSYFCHKSNDYGVNLYDDGDIKYDIHLHVPEGAVPKDGPSAGIAIFTSIASIFLNKLVDSSVAMTGEITLHGKVLAIGGLKEKLLAASRGGIRKVIIPKENEKDLKEIKKDIEPKLDIVFVSNASEVLPHVLIDNA